MDTDDDATFTRVDLAEGANVITVTVTAENTDTQDYVVTVTREAAPLSSDATLSSLEFFAGSTATGTPLTLTPPFDATSGQDAASVEYAATVPNATTQVTIEWIATEAPAATATDIASGTLFRNPHTLTLNTGATLATSIAVTITAPDGVTTKEFVFRVTREAPVGMDATLQSLTIDSGTLMPAFSADVRTYTASVGNDVVALVVDALETDSAADFVAIASDQDPAASFDSVALTEGANVITVTVTAEDGTTMLTYTLTVTREAPVVTAPAVPTGVQAARGAVDRVNVSWTPPSPAPAGYEVCVLTPSHGGGL